MKTKLMIIATAAIVLLLGSCLGKAQVPAALPSASSDKPTSHTYASNAKLAALLDGTDKTPYLLLDVRTEAEYDEGHIPGAVLLPFDQIGPGKPDVPKDRLIIIYCRSGRRSATAAETLKGLGFTNLADFGGLTNWRGVVEK